ncbi:site-specific integrase, partial [Parabacteroides distasonis]|uniref:site-specific integrase n=1 Tax=Parabacteroides distasonis TaxID=823 RepID=UPI00189EC854
RLLTRDNLCLAEDGTWWIKSARQKTKIEFEIPLLDLPLQILKKYDDTAPGDKLLPVYCNSMLNHYLKEIAQICHIDRPLVFHTARHTYATEITLSHGVPLETVSKMLGHSQIETTQIYAKVTDDKIDADTKALNRKISERFSVII